MPEHKLAWQDQSDTSPVMIATSIYRNKERIDIRRYWTNGAGTLCPTKKGISIPFVEFVEFLDTLYGLDEDVAAMMDAWVESRYGE